MTTTEQAELKAVKIKPLEWEGCGHWAHGPDEGWMEEADTPFGWGYSVEFGREGNFRIDSTFDWSQDGFETPDEAKVAAQADYEQRILSALEPDDRLVTAMEALRAWDKWNAMPVDRGGKNGPKGKAFQKFIALKDAALRTMEGEDE